MRLYKLVKRVGDKKSSIFPWGEAPLAEKPDDWFGWTWDMDLMEWVQKPMRSITLDVMPMREPKPDKEPRPFQDVIVPGWSWNGRTDQWEQVPMPMRWKVVTPERPPAPETGPARGFAWTVPGWEWSLWEGEWKPVPMEKIEVPYFDERGPKPEYPPGFLIKDEAEDWFWDYGLGQWSPSTIYAESVDFDPPDTLPPDVNTANVFPYDPFFAADYAAAEALVAQGAWHILEQGNAFFRLVAELHGIRPDIKNPVPIAESVFDARHIMHAKGVWLASQEAWQMEINAMAPHWWDLPVFIGAIALIFLFMAGVAFLVGLILERFTRDKDDDVNLYPDLETYLMGPDDWTYASLAGCSLRAEPYFRSCDSIGSVNDHHLRGEPWQIDRIAFTPGGFLEEGWKGGRFVKYRWKYWEIEYVGFLIRRGASLYSLQDGYYLPGHPTAGLVVPVEYVCPEFRTYL